MFKKPNSYTKMDNFDKYRDYKYTEQDIICELKRLARYINENVDSYTPMYFNNMRTIYDNLIKQDVETKPYNGATLFDIMAALTTKYSVDGQKTDYPISEILNETIKSYTDVDYDTGMTNKYINVKYDKEKKTFVNVDN